MRRIVRIRFDAWKGLNHEVELSPIVLLAGPNGSGKTAHLEAIQFVLTGSTSLGGRVDGAASLVGPSGGGVTITDDEGATFTRGVVRDHRTGVVSQSVSASTSPRIGVREFDALMASRFGAFAPAFDLSAWVGMSPDKKRSFVLDLCKQAAGDVGVVDAIELEALCELLTHRAAALVATTKFGCDLDHLQAEQRRELVATLKSSVAPATIEQLDAAISRVRTAVKSADFSAAVAEAATAAAARVSEMRRERDEAQQASRRLGDARHVGGEPIEAMRSRRDAMRAKATQIGSMLAEQAALAATRESLATNLRTAEAAYNAAVSARAALPPANSIPSEDEVVALEAEADRIAEMAVMPSGSAEALRLAHEEASSRVASLKAELASHKNQQLDADAALKRAKAASDANPWPGLLACVNQFESAGDTDIVAVLSERISREGLDAWRQLSSTIRDRYAASNADALYQAIETASHDLRRHTSNVYLTEAALATAESTATACGEALAAKEAEIRELSQRCRQATADAAAKRKSAAAMRRQRDAAVSALERAELDVQKALESKLAAEQNLSSLAQGVGAAVDVSQLELQRDGCAAAIAAIDAEIDVATRAAAVATEFAAAVRRSESAERAVEAAMLVQKGVKAVRDSAMTNLVSPLVEHMSRFLSAAMPDWVVYCDLFSARQSPIFELGVMRGATRVPMGALSGGESVLFGASLAYALVQLSGVPFRPLLLEAAEVERDRLNALMSAVFIVSETISNAVICTWWYPGEPYLPGVQVIGTASHARVVAA